jgi:hypothetical protein
MGETRLPQLIGESQYVFRACAAPMHHQHGSPSTFERLTRHADRLSLMRVLDGIHI